MTWTPTDIFLVSETLLICLCKLRLKRSDTYDTYASDFNQTLQHFVLQYKQVLTASQM